MIEIIEVVATHIDDAIAKVELSEARLISCSEGEPTITECWEKPTGLSDPNEK